MEISNKDKYYAITHATFSEFSYIYNIYFDYYSCCELCAKRQLLPYFYAQFFVFSGRTLTKYFTRNFMSPNSVEAPKKITKMEELNFNFHLINN